MAGDSSIEPNQKGYTLYSPDEITTVADALESNEDCPIEWLELKDLNELTAVRFFTAMATNTTLKRLKIDNTEWDGMNREGAAALSAALVSNKSLEELDIFDASLVTNDIASIAEAMKRNSALKAFCLFPLRDHCRITNFAGMLASNTTLRCLNLSDNSLPEEDVVLLANALKRNSALVDLNLAGCDVGDNGTIGIAEVLKHNHTLEKLRLDDNDITPTGIIAIANGLEENTRLKELNLAFSNLEGQGGLVALDRLGGALVVNSTLRSLNLSCCSQAFHETNPMAKAIELNHTLQELILSQNYISGDGVTSLARALEHNTGLRKLDFSQDNVLDESCALAMAKALKRNTTLVELGLTGCDLDDSASILVEALKYNRTLTTLNMGSNVNVGERSTVAFMDAMESNTTLTKHRVYRSNCWEVEDPGEPYIAACNHHAALQLYPFVAKSGTWVDIVDNYCSRNVALQYAIRAGDALAAVNDGSTLQWAMTQVLQVLRQGLDVPWVFLRSWCTLLYTVLRKQILCADSVVWLKIRNRLVRTDDDPTAVTTRKRKTLA